MRLNLMSKSIEKIWIQCPRCENFVAKNSYNYIYKTYMCNFCGKVSKKEMDKSKNKLIYREVQYEQPEGAR